MSDVKAEILRLTRSWSQTNFVLRQQGKGHFM
jgi:hypothetical protein